MSNRSKTEIINSLWQEGKTIKEINDEFHLITNLPEELEGVTKNTILDYSRRHIMGKITVTRLAASGYYFHDGKKETSHAIRYTAFKSFKIYEGE